MSAPTKKNRLTLRFELEEVLLELVFDTLSASTARRLPEIARYSARILELVDGNSPAETLSVTAEVQPLEG